MAMLDKTDLDFTNPEYLRRKVVWRPVNEDDLVYQALWVLVLVGLLIYGVVTHTDSGFKLYAYTILWLFLVYLQVRSFVILYRKYKRGEKIRAGILPHAIRNKG